ncbi:hypothetical protein [Alienimonas californiensis]|uniref:Uncharacterized protein n=1 Tax=Alienimonas californiensis TaxID=2527989 RepID=A0A517P799_9PLAN|nr:hypothetical protein [Alienimonas californiensis]QDT15251.1 hypothetical protein CA12_13340 [Alienimonas californiensis]
MRVPNVVPPALAALGPPLAAWGGYGLGVGLGLGTGGPLWTGANLLAGGLIAVGGGAGLAAAVLGRSRSVESAPAAARSFAEDAAALDAFAPAVVRHPRGAAALKALAELLFEVHHPADSVAATEGGAE